MLEDIDVKIKCVELEMAYKYEVELVTDSYVYGVETAKPIFLQMLGKSNVEKVGLLCLDHTNKIINYSTISIGNTDSVVTSVAQIIKIALLSNADKILIAHNHPSGVLDITSDDIKITQKIGKAANLFQIQLIDSLIVNASDEIVSIREKIGETKNDISNL